MPGLRLVASGDLGPLADHWVTHRPPGDPLDREVVVVPNVVVGQWFEQAVARRTGVDGGTDGVAANLDILLVAGFLGRVLYGRDSAMDAWRGAALAVEIHEADRRCSMSEALHRGDVLAALVALRGDDLDDFLTPERDAERRVIASRADRGVLTPTATLAKREIEVNDRGVTLFGVLASPYGPLTARVSRALADSADVSVYAALGSRTLLDPPTGALEDRSLVERWGAPLVAHLELWRENAGFDDEVWIDADDGDGPSVVAALSARATATTEKSLAPLLEVHSTVGLARQVEVARDAVLAALAAEGVAPHSVRVAAVDPAATAPLISAYFQPSSADADAAPRLPVEIADPAVPRRSLRLDAFLSVLQSIGGTSTQHDLAALLTAPALREGLGLTVDQAERVVARAAEGRVGVGLDARDPSRDGVFESGSDSGTWRRLLDRLALATCYDPGGGSDIAPLGSSDDLASAAATSTLVDALSTLSAAARGDRPLREWARTLGELASLIEHDERVRDPSLDRVIDGFNEVAIVSDRDVNLDDVRGLVDALAARGGGASLLGRGGVSMVGLSGAAAIPFELSVIVGLDDESMPDAARSVDELGEARATDPDPRAELRAGLLLALASTRRRVLLFTSDRRAVDGADLDPAFVLDELNEALAEGDPPVRTSRRRHPRHGFSSPSGERADVATRGDEVFTFDPVHGVAATRLGQGATSDVVLPLARVHGAPTDPGPIDLEEMVRFFRYPQRVFLRDAFASARLPDAAPERPDAPPVTAGSALDLYAWREAALTDAVASGVDPVAPTGPDSVVGTVAAGWRGRALAELDVEGLAAFASALRGGFAAAGARRAPPFAVPAVVSGPVRDVARGPLPVYETDAGPVLVEFTPARSYGARLVGAVARAALATVESGRAVPALLLRAATADEALQHPRRPALAVRWRGADAVAAAIGLLDELIALYDDRLVRLPLHANATSLATDERFGPNGEKVVRHPNQEWLWRDYGARSDHGESQSAECRALLPLTYGELREVLDGAFVAQSLRLTRALRAVDVERHVTDAPWLDVLGVSGG